MAVLVPMRSLDVLETIETKLVREQKRSSSSYYSGLNNIMFNNNINMKLHPKTILNKIQFITYFLHISKTVY